MCCTHYEISAFLVPVYKLLVCDMAQCFDSCEKIQNKGNNLVQKPYTAYVHQYFQKSCKNMWTVSAQKTLLFWCRLQTSRGDIIVCCQQHNVDIFSVTFFIESYYIKWWKTRTIFKRLLTANSTHAAYLNNKHCKFL